MPLSLPEAERLKVFGRQPSIPADLRIYAVGDIHGRLDLLDQLLSLIDADIALHPTSRPLPVFLGDYIDRGAFSRETIDRLIQLGSARECVFLKGNHELIALKCLSDRNLFDQWMRLGGLETLMSYGVSFGQLASGKPIVELQAAFHHALPQSHLRFFRDLQLSFECGDFFFAHAGVKPGVELSSQMEYDLLWIREEFLSSNEDFGKIVIHGHTPTPDIEVLPNRINIDTGAFATDRLSCLVIEGASLSVIDTLQAESTAP
jgi:diadenosine tetraphosphatase ApaH/serine/threonine PP2A family protein phosphatase